MWVTKLLISPVKGFFAQKRPNLARNWHFCQLLTHLVPCWWVGWWLWRRLYLARHLFTLCGLASRPKNRIFYAQADRRRLPPHQEFQQTVFEKPADSFKLA